METLRRTLQFALPIGLLGLGAAGASVLARMREEPQTTAPAVHVPLVRTVVAEERPVELTVHARGTVTPRTETLLAAEVSGRIVRLSPALASGGFFDEGDELLAIDDADYVLAVEEAKGRVAAAQLALSQEQAEADLARRDWESLASDDEPGPLVLREPQLARARAETSAAQSALEKAERDVERCAVRAPYPGRVKGRAVDVGQYVTPGHELARVFAVDWAEVRLPVADQDLARLDLPLAGPAGRGGGPAPLGAEEFAREWPAVELRARFAGEERAWLGQVERIEGEIDPRSRMVVLVARVEDPYGRRAGAGAAPLLAGAFVDAAVAGRRLPAAVVLPRAAVQAGDRVYVLGAEQRLEIRDVTVLESRRDEVVLSAGIAPGERVVVSPLELPVEGMQLEQEAERTEDAR